MDSDPVEGNTILSSDSVEENNILESDSFGENNISESDPVEGNNILESDSVEENNVSESDFGEEKFEYEIELDLPAPKKYYKRKTCGIPDCEPCNMQDCTTCKGCVRKKRCYLKNCPEYAKMIGAVPSNHGNTIQMLKKKRMCGIPDCEPCNRLDCTTCKGCRAQRRCHLRYCPEYAEKSGAKRPISEPDSPVPTTHGKGRQVLGKKKMCGIPDCEPCNRLDCTTCKGCLYRRRCFMRYCPEYAKKTGEKPPVFDVPTVSVPSNYGKTIQMSGKKRTCGIPGCEPCSRMDCTTCKGCLYKKRCHQRYCPEYAKKTAPKQRAAGPVIRVASNKKMCGIPGCQPCNRSSCKTCKGCKQNKRCLQRACAEFSKLTGAKFVKPTEQPVPVAPDFVIQNLDKKMACGIPDCEPCNTPDCTTCQGCLTNRGCELRLCPEYENSIQQKTSKEHVCSGCGTELSTSANLRRHQATPGACERIIKKISTPKGVNPCPNCGAIYKTRSGLAKHKVKCKGVLEVKEELDNYAAQFIEVTPNIDHIAANIKEEVDDYEMCDNAINLNFEPESQDVKKEIADDNDVYSTQFIPINDEDLENTNQEIDDNERYNNEITPVSKFGTKNGEAGTSDDEMLSTEVTEDGLKDAEEIAEDEMQENDPLGIDTDTLTEGEQTEQDVMYECTVCNTRKTDKKQMKLHLLSHFQLLIRRVKKVTD